MSYSEQGRTAEDAEPMHLAVRENRTDLGAAGDEPDVVFWVVLDADLDDEQRRRNRFHDR